VTDALTDVERLSRLADDLLLLARLDSGAAGRPSEPVDIGTLTEGEAGALYVDGDEVALRRLLGNLTGNARRHARGRVEVGASREGDDIVVTVDDDGPGIPPEERERVFQRWVRLDAGRSRDEGGAGLGLSIARSIARLHGGDVTLEAGPLGGLRAILRLPASSRRPEPSTARR
jgi:signal transduction histidine kinase